MLLQKPATKVEQKKAAQNDSQEESKTVTIGQIGHYFAVFLVVFVALAPLYWTFITSIKSGVELFVSPPTLIPHSFEVTNYIQVFNSPFFLPTLKNSAVVALLTTLISLIIGILCAYALARLQFLGKSDRKSTRLNSSHAN